MAAMGRQFFQFDQGMKVFTVTTATKCKSQRKKSSNKFEVKIGGQKTSTSKLTKGSCN